MLTIGKCRSQQLPKYRRNVLLVVLKHDPFGLLLWSLSLFVCFVFVCYSWSFLSEETFRCLIVSMPLLFRNTCLKYKYKIFNSSTASHTIKLLFWSTHGKWVLFPTEQWKHCTESECFRLDSRYAPSLLTRTALRYWQVCMYWDEKEVWFTLSFLLFSCCTPHKWLSHEQKWRR